MQWHTPTGPLAHEHRIIERLIALMSYELDAMRTTKIANLEFIGAATDFIRSYADRCHHGKEEDILFRVLSQKSLPSELAAAMDKLVREHAYARVVTGRLVAAAGAYGEGDVAALDTIVQAMSELVDFYPPHIDQEDHHFFRQCLQYLAPDEQKRMLEEYEEFDRALIHEKYRLVVENLESARAVQGGSL